MRLPYVWFVFLYIFLFRSFITGLQVFAILMFFLVILHTMVFHHSHQHHVCPIDGLTNGFEYKMDMP